MSGDNRIIEVFYLDEAKAVIADVLANAPKTYSF